MMDYKGAFPKRMLRKAAFVEKHFEDESTFSLVEEDPVTKQEVRRLISNPKATKDFSAVLLGAGDPKTPADKKKVLQLADLLEKMMHLDPDKRIKPTEALQHPFIKERAG
mmetsp:Transcript_69590/g.220335  ORF Transcript_69590/g.220335 Transcript_69590/m.220335 type:complete len:110 (+) Transcript_69590:40-369(+)